METKKKSLMTIKCPKCGKETELNIGKTIDELGEVYQCQHCQWPFRYVEK